MAKHEYNIKSDTRKVSVIENRPAVKINGITYVGKRFRSAICSGEEVKVLFRATKKCNSVTVVHEPTATSERWLSLAAWLSGRLQQDEELEPAVAVAE